MTTFYDVPAEDLNEAVAERIDIEAPEWAEFTKTGISRDLPPEQEDFWAVRAASILRTVAKDGPVGVERLRTKYGDAKQGSNRYTVRPNRKVQGSGKIIRTILQQLEDEDLVAPAEAEGRRISGQARALLDDTASDLLEDLDRPELERYA